MDIRIGDVKKSAIRSLDGKPTADSFVYFAFIIRMALVIRYLISIIADQWIRFFIFDLKIKLGSFVYFLNMFTWMVLGIFITIPFMFSYHRLLLLSSNGENNYDYDVLYYYKNDMFGVVGVKILTCVYAVLWMLVPVAGIVIAIVKVFAYSMTDLVKIDNPNWTANECITESRRLMKGYKWKLFLLILSFLGWYILSFFTLGIIYPWVFSYAYASIVEFYKRVKEAGSNIWANDNIENNEENIEDREQQDEVYASETYVEEHAVIDNNEQETYNHKGKLQDRTRLLILTIVLSLVSFVGMNIYNNRNAIKRYIETGSFYSTPNTFDESSIDGFEVSKDLISGKETYKIWQNISIRLY